MKPGKTTYNCPNECGTKHEPDAVCPRAMAACEHARLHWKSVEGAEATIALARLAKTEA